MRDRCSSSQMRRELEDSPAAEQVHSGASRSHWRGNLRSKERRGQDARKPGTSACRNSDKTRQHPPLCGRRTSWLPPGDHAIREHFLREYGDAEVAGPNRQLVGENFNLVRKIVGAILLARRCRLRAVGLAGLLFARRYDAFLAGRHVVVLPQARLNFGDDAQVVHEFCALGVHQVRLAIGVAIDRSRTKIGELRLAEVEAEHAEQNRKRAGHGERAIREAHPTDVLEPAEEGAPAGDGFAFAERLVEDRVDEARRRLNLLHHVHAREELGQVSDERGATRAVADVSLERHAVVPRHSVVEVIAEPRFDLFASPDHFRSVLLSLFLSTATFYSYFYLR